MSSVVSLILVLTLGPVLTWFIISGSGHGEFSMVQFVLMCVFYYFLMWLFLFCRPFRRWQWRRFYARHLREKPLAVEWIFSEADVIHRGGAESSTRFAWEHFTRAIQRPDGFLLETQNKHFHWIPRKSLPSNESFDALAGLLKQNISRYEN